MIYIYVLLILSGLFNMILLSICYYLASEIQKYEFILKEVGKIIGKDIKEIVNDPISDHDPVESKD